MNGPWQIRVLYDGDCPLCSREIRFLEPAIVAFLMTRHDDPPPGVAGGRPGTPGRITFTRDGKSGVLTQRARMIVRPGDVLRIETPGGGGFGRA